MKKSLLFPILLIILPLLSTCKKYEEGGNSLFKKQKIQGDWQIESFTVDGQDSLSYFLNSILPVCDNFISLEKESKLKVRCGNIEISNKSGWEIGNSKTAILTMNIILWDPISYLRTVSYSWAWEIYKLKGKEMWLKAYSFNEPFQKGKIYELHLSKIK